MRAAATCLGLAGVVVVGSWVLSCGSSSGGTCTASCVPGCPCPDAATSDTQGAPDTSKDTRTPLDTSPPPTDSGPAEAPPADASGCVGLDATASQIGISKTCETCVATNCCSQFEACKSNAACVAIETCTGTCIAMGGAVSTCATSCIGDSGSATGVSDADALDGCIVGSCSSACGAP